MPPLLVDTPISVINEILSLTPVIVQQDKPLLMVAKKMVTLPCVHIACVVDKDQHLVGLLPLQNLADDLFQEILPIAFLRTTHDLEDALHFADVSRTQTAGDAMILPISVYPESTLKEAFTKMHDHQLPGIPIVNRRNQVTGYINLLELLATYARGQQGSTS